MLIALTREVSASINDCQLTQLERTAIDVGRAREQHLRYEEALRAAGCTVQRLAQLDEFPDAVFVEDAAVVVEELAVITRPGAESRRGETASVAEALRRFRTVVEIEAPGTLDGGDVLRNGDAVFVGISERTNEAGAAQLAMHLEPYGYFVHRVPVHGALHLKSAVTFVSDDRVVLNPAWIDRAAFDGYDVVEVDPGEPFGANVLRVNGNVFASPAFPRTNVRLGVGVTELDCSELEKAEGALTCGSVIFTV
jgi:dimethylargininase